MKKGQLCNLTIKKTNLYANEFQSYVMNLTLNKDVKRKCEQLKEVIFKVGIEILVLV